MSQKKQYLLIKQKKIQKFYNILVEYFTCTIKDTIFLINKSNSTKANGKPSNQNKNTFNSN
jgi:hypothetical protein